MGGLNHLTARLTALAFAALTAASGGAESWRIASRVNGGSERSVPVVFVRLGDTVSLTCETVRNGKPAPLSEASIQWREIQPVLRSGYDNMRGTMDSVAYRSGGNLGAQATIHLKFSPDQCGTHYYTVSGTTAGKPISGLPAIRFQTAEPLQRAFAGHVVQVVCRPDDSYLGYLRELMGTPFIMGPGVTKSGFHQTDQRVGSDCAELAIYGRRRMGFPVPYCGPSGIVRYLKEIVPSEVSANANGIYLDAQGRPITVGAGGIKPGDILHFGAQVSVFYQDRGVRGKLDAADLLLESWGSTPHVTTIRQCGFYQFPVHPMRWRP